MARLEAKAADEERTAVAARRTAAIRQVEAKLLPELIAPFEQLERSALSVLTSIEHAQRALAKFIKDYPPELEKPYAHNVSLDRAVRTINAANRVLSTEWGQCAKLPSKIGEARDILTGLADDERKHHAELIADLQQSPAPQTESEIAA